MVPVVPFSDFFAAIARLSYHAFPYSTEASRTVDLVVSLKGHAAVAEILDRVNENHPPHRDAERHLRSAIHNEESERRGARIGASPGNTFAHCYSKLNPRMLPNHKYPIPQREPLLRIVRNRRIHRSMSNRNACRRRNHVSGLTVAAALTARIRSLSTRARRRSVSSRSTLAYNIVARHQIVNT